MPREESQMKPFDLKTEMQKALEWIVAYKAERRAEMEAKGETDDVWYAQECYTTATELERRVRAAAAEQMDGKPYGSNGFDDFAMKPFQVRGLNGIPLLHHCRSFLLRHPKLNRHNFGRGHVSGERFRTDDMPLSTAEQRTMAEKAKVKPVHLRRPTTWKPLCTATRQPKRSAFSADRGRPASNVTSDPAKVTCPRCLKLIAANGLALDTARAQ